MRHAETLDLALESDLHGVAVKLGGVGDRIWVALPACNTGAGEMTAQHRIYQSNATRLLVTVDGHVATRVRGLRSCSMGKMVGGKKSRSDGPLPAAGLGP